MNIGWILGIAGTVLAAALAAHVLGRSAKAGDALPGPRSPAAAAAPHADERVPAEAEGRRPDTA